MVRNSYFNVNGSLIDGTITAQDSYLDFRGTTINGGMFLDHSIVTAVGGTTTLNGSLQLGMRSIFRGAGQMEGITGNIICSADSGYLGGPFPVNSGSNTCTSL